MSRFPSPPLISLIGVLLRSIFTSDLAAQSEILQQIVYQVDSNSTKHQADEQRQNAGYEAKRGRRQRRLNAFAQSELPRRRGHLAVSSQRVREHSELVDLAWNEI